jgi:ABC-type sugar transport system ATPase subunit
MPAQTVLELRDIVKSFPGVRALDGAKFELRAGECHALVGENGAGKSTLMNVLAGVCQPEAGQVLLAGREVAFPNPHSAVKQGIGVVFQELSLVPNLSVAENIFAHRQPTRWLNLIDWPTLHRRTADMLAMFHLAIHPATLVKTLSMAQRQVVEILKALSHGPKVVILDEPTSSLTALETKLLFDNIRHLKSEGVAFIYISHHLKEIFEVADRVTVMRDGRYVDTMNTRDTTEEAIVRKMVGRELLNVYGQRKAPVGEAYFRVEGAGRGGVFQEVAFELGRGEILGLAGLVGSGRTELGRAICGIERLESGTMTLNGEPLKIAGVHQAISRGLGYLTEDRKDQGLFLRMAIRDNFVAPSLREFAGALGWMNDGLIRRHADTIRGRFNIVSPSTSQLVGRLSGGNQQKVLLSMWMGIRPRLLIVDEPTRGVDVGARSEIYALLRDLAATGVGILMISSDLQEILGLADRVLVMRGGRVVAQLPRETATEENIIAAATGVQLEGERLT